MLADEPLASLDPFHQLATLDLLRATARRGIGVAVVLHDLTLAARVADDVVLLKDGAVLASGPAATVLTAEHLGAAYGVVIARIDHPHGTAIVPLAPT
jgi:iron complex transport system ATP-binding protein